MKNKINILQLLLSLNVGGLENLVIDLCVLLNKNGFQSQICCLDSHGLLANKALNKGVKVSVIKRSSGVDISLFIRLTAYFKKNNIQIVHTHNNGPCFYGTVSAKLSGVPVTLNTRHGDDPKSLPSLIWNLNNKIIAVSNNTKNTLIKYNKLNPKKIKIIHNGIDLKEFDYNLEDHLNEKKKLGLESSRVIGTVSRLSPEKDQFSLIEAFAKVVVVDPCAKLVFVGDGNLRNELEAHVKKLGLKDKVIFFGFRNDISSIIRSFDVFVLPSLMEGVSLSLLEAMATELPVVVTNVGGNPEVVIDGETGFLVPPKEPQEMADAIVRMLQNPELAQKMGEAGRKRVEEKFSLDRMVKEYQDIYEQCLLKKGFKINS